MSQYEILNSYWLFAFYHSTIFYMSNENRMVETDTVSNRQEDLDPHFDIVLKRNSEAEQKIRMMLENILRKYDLKKWTLTQKVIIEEEARPHSHPVLTLGTRSKNENIALASFLHEQIHWIEVGAEEIMNAAIAELKDIYPGAPVGSPEGGDTLKSTYRVCRLELLALKELLGEEKAKEIILNKSGYRWMNRTVIEDGATIDRIIQKYFPHQIQ
jgi:hypothetical protein